MDTSNKNNVPSSQGEAATFGEYAAISSTNSAKTQIKDANQSNVAAVGQSGYQKTSNEIRYGGDFSDTTGDNIPDYDITIDQDRDWLSDSYEDNHGFDKTKQDTDNNGVKDLEEESIAAESNWTNDSHNNQDWSKPGKNSGN